MNRIGFMLFFWFEFVSFFLLAFKGGSGGLCIQGSYTSNIYTIPRQSTAIVIIVRILL